MIVGSVSVNELAQAGDTHQPVLERLDLDRLRFQEAMHRDAERAELQRQRLDDGKRYIEENRRQRAADRVIRIRHSVMRS